MFIEGRKTRLKFSGEWEKVRSGDQSSLLYGIRPIKRDTGCPFLSAIYLVRRTASVTAENELDNRIGCSSWLKIHLFTKGRCLHPPVSFFFPCSIVPSIISHPLSHGRSWCFKRNEIVSDYLTNVMQLNPRESALET